MSNIITKIKAIPNLYHATGCTTRQLKEAQNELEIEFPEEYIDYVKEYGAISFYRTEWTGLNVEGYLNVVEVTKQERDLNSAFPADCFVVENQGIDGLIIISDENGCIYSIQYNKKELLCESLVAYLEICIARKK
ncbi:SMI1/KNR4 family protein [Clostridium sp. ZS2-4]|uniref:SMI1/KNR4 family protein n=1 Tax=Clostridium sp. ZS2-4 TaxID=2987703 RepID=UPI00227A166B|nr:SMI1/KNR4 family protein [Clostridium sp. ZS2-4]MCY6356063.1 SMI1/KNR4 family protein [Clostridium sp. ZS2-4]